MEVRVVLYQESFLKIQDCTFVLLLGIEESPNIVVDRGNMSMVLPHDIFKDIHRLLIMVDRAPSKSPSLFNNAIPMLL